MPTLRRIVKYTPALVLGLLVAAWMVLAFSSVGYKARHFIIGGQSSCIGAVFTTDEQVIVGKPGWHFGISIFRIRNLIGSLEGSVDRFHGGNLLVTGHLPIPALVTLWLPVAIGPFLSFRFRLWHYFAYTALVALELAYYLWWQASLVNP